jgi:hypothetical protein
LFQEAIKCLAAVNNFLRGGGIKYIITYKQINRNKIPGVLVLKFIPIANFVRTKHGIVSCFFDVSSLAFCLFYIRAKAVLLKAVGLNGG